MSIIQSDETLGTGGPPTANFLNVPAFSPTFKGKGSSPTSQHFGDSHVKFDFTNSCSKISEVSTYQEENTSFIPKDDNINGLTLDKVLGSTFRKIDFTSIQDFSSELFPCQPNGLNNTKPRFNPQKVELPEIQALSNSKEEKTRAYERLQGKIKVINLKGSASLSPSHLKPHIQELLWNKQGRQSLFLDKGKLGTRETIMDQIPDKVLEELAPKVTVKLSEQLKDSGLYSSAIKLQNKYIESKKVGVRNSKAIVNLTPARSIERSVERRRAAPPRGIVKDRDEIAKGINFSIEGKSIDWHSQPTIQKNSSIACSDPKYVSIASLIADEKYEMPNLRIHQMLDNKKIYDRSLKKGSMSKNYEELPSGSIFKEDKWDLFNKYKDKFGIKPKEYFGIELRNNSIDHKPLHSTKRLPTPMTYKRSYGDIDLSRVKQLYKGNT